MSGIPYLAWSVNAVSYARSSKKMNWVQLTSCLQRLKDCIDLLPFSASFVEKKRSKKASRTRISSRTNLKRQPKRRFFLLPVHSEVHEVNIKENCLKIYVQLVCSVFRVAIFIHCPTWRLSYVLVHRLETFVFFFAVTHSFKVMLLEKSRRSRRSRVT